MNTRRNILRLAATTPLLIATPVRASTRVPPRPEGFKWYLMPSLYFLEGPIRTQRDNCWTLHYSWMMRAPADDPLCGQTVHVNTRTYREWLAEGDYFQPTDTAGIPPHISFGGAVVPGKGDPTFHQRWCDYARKEFGL